MDIETLTVGDLIAMLQEYDLALPVVGLYEYGDHWNSMLALTFDSPEIVKVKYSSYHHAYKLDTSNDDDDDDDDDDDTIEVLSLTGG
jgi:hypothetical protein